MRTHRQKAASALLAAALMFAFAGTAAAQEKPAGALSPEQQKQAREALEKGVKFLEGKVNPDGSWGREPGVSGLVTLALLKSGRTLKDPVVRKSVDALILLQKPDGGLYDQRIANYTTSVIVQVLAATKDPRCKETLAKAHKFLIGAQIGAGDGVDTKDPGYGGLNYGGSGRMAGRADLSNTQMWADAMAELEKAGVKRDSDAWKRAVVFAGRCQNRSESNDQKFAFNDGGATYGPWEGGQYSVKLPDGRSGLLSYGSMTYAFLKTMIYADVKKDDPRVKSACDWIGAHYTLEENPGVGQSGLYYYYHTMAKALNAMGEPEVTDDKGVRHAWRADLVNKLLSLQAGDGSWVNKSDRWWESDPVLVTAYAVLTLDELLQK